MAVLAGSETDRSVRDRLLMVSADCHGGPRSMEEYRPYLPSRSHAAYDEYLAAVRAHDDVVAAARRSRDTGAKAFRALFDERGSSAGLWDPRARLEELEAEGIVGDVVFPQGSVPFHRYPALSPQPGMQPVVFDGDQEMLRHGVRAYNRWLAALCSQNPGRHAGVAVLPLADVDAAVEEVRFARENGLFGGVSLPPIQEGGNVSPYNDRRYDALWAVCQDLKMPLNVHGGGRYTECGSGPEVTALRLAETDWYCRRTLWFLVFSGVFERFPRLHCVFTEQRAHWVPGLLEELDSIYRTPNGGLRGTLPRSPSEYFADNVFIGASFLSRKEAELRDAIGVHKLMWGSDYPHPEGTWPWSWASLGRALAGASREELEAIVGGNALDCYDFDRTLLRAAADRAGPTRQQLLETPQDRPPGSEFSWGFRDDGPWT